MTSRIGVKKTTLQPLTPEQRASRQALIDAANAEMCATKRAALDTYTRVHKVGHPGRCTDACRETHKTLVQDLADSNARYQSVMDGMS